MKKNYTLLACSFLMSIGLFGQTNLLLNPTFTSGDDWRGDAVGGCTGAEIGAYDSSETNTADGSGCWQINACDNNNNRLLGAQQVFQLMQGLLVIIMGLFLISQ